MSTDSFKFACPSCGQHIAVSPDQVGAQAECPTCGRPLIVPDPTGPPAKPPLHAGSGLKIPLPTPPPSRRLALGFALVTAAILVIISITAYVRSGGKIGRTPFQQINPESVLYVAVTRTGQLYANGKEVELDDLRGLLAKTKRQNGMVKFYQERGANAEGSDVSRQALRLVEGMSLPVSYSTKHDKLEPFFGESGNSVP